MASKLEPTPELLEAILARVPEGFIRERDLKKRIKITGRRNSGTLDETLGRGQIGKVDNLLYDLSRISPQEVKARKIWCRPDHPAIHKDGTLPQRPIVERLQERDRSLANDRIAQSIFQIMEEGFVLEQSLRENAEMLATLDHLLEVGWLARFKDFIYDPLRLSQSTMKLIQDEHELEPIRQAIFDLLEQQPEHVINREALYEKYDRTTVNEVLSMGGFSTFSVKMKRHPYSSVWVCPKGSDMKVVRQVAEDAVKIKDEDWEVFLQICGDVVRPGARDGKTWRIRVVARSYTVSKAAKRLNLHKSTIEQAIEAGDIGAFEDPEGLRRIPAEHVERAFFEDEAAEVINRYERLSAKQIALVSGLSYSSVRRRLNRAGISRSEPTWGEVRGRWRLPDTLTEFLTVLEERRAEQHAIRMAELAEEERLRREQAEEERLQRKMLHDRLVDAFPTWKHDGRIDQHISLHIGPPNSGKTHDSLEALVEVGTGWYLAPLRLLAYEVFDRLNQRGVLCNLLTGEEHIEIPGATITAATIEMLSPNKSGECVVIDEAQMLADSDRGWAWTRALMEAEAPEIHVIAPPTAQSLVEKLAHEAGIPISIIKHQRLAPLQVAEQHWPLDQLPPHTILVAFSRRTVLHLKTELERMKRKVSVIYGGLPPEVRRKQADRFAEGETEICVATDAVGMGLNLPADYVCFYEVEKFDGYQVRQLFPGEIHQIGGRAGRYGLRKSGEIGATNKKDLKVVRHLFEQSLEPISRARIAPSVEDLELMPGSLWERLEQWAQLQSIPESLREIIETADLTERTELASMLTDEEVDQLGLSAALKIVNAPTRQSSRQYWYSCAQSILNGRSMPPPPQAPRRIQSSRDLETAEQCISCADIYLWLGSRREFNVFALDEETVRYERGNWSMQIDEALLRQLDTTRRCPECGRPLPLGHRHRLCDRCFYSQRYSNN